MRVKEHHKHKFTTENFIKTTNNTTLINLNPYVLIIKVKLITIILISKPRFTLQILITKGISKARPEIYKIFNLAPEQEIKSV